MQIESRWQFIEVGLASLLLLVPVFLFGAPPEWFYGQSIVAPVGIITVIGLWVLPTLLSMFVLYHTTRGEVTSSSIILASLGGVTLLVLLLNLRATALSEGGLLTYEGRGAFFGPFVSLLTGCLLALGLLFDAFSRANSPSSGSTE